MTMLQKNAHSLEPLPGSPGPGWHVPSSALGPKSPAEFLTPGGLPHQRQHMQTSLSGSTGLHLSGCRQPSPDRTQSSGTNAAAVRRHRYLLLVILRSIR